MISAQSSRVKAIRAAILGLFVILAALYTLTIPLGEAYDEWAHFAYVRHVVNHGRIPASGQRLLPEIGWDATHHPPLYYLIGALATQGIDMTDNLRPRVNPHLPDGYTLNAYIQGPEHRWPWSGSVLGMRVVRGVSLVMGALTVLLTYHIGRRLAPDRPHIALGAMAIVALMPQFLFTSSIITNDIPIALLAAIATLLSVRLLQSPCFRDLILLTLTTLAAILTKATGVALLPAAMTVLIVVAARSGVASSVRRRLAFVAGGALLLCGAAGGLFLWEAWNAFLHGHHSSVSGAVTKIILPLIRAGAGQRGSLLAWDILPAGLGYTYQTFWAAFGMGNIPADGAFYVAMTIVNLLAGLGVALAIRRRNGAMRKSLLALGIIAFWTLIPPMFIILASRLFFVAPGRYVMSLAPIVAIVQALGLAELAPRNRQAVTLATYVSLLLAFAIAVPWLYIRPAYHWAERINQSRLEEVAQPLEFRFGDGLALVGYRLATQTARPGGNAEIVLYWKCLEQMQEDYTISVQLLDPNFVFYGGVQSFPGRGTQATSLWKPGEIIEDRYLIRIGDDLAAPTFAMIQVKAFQHETHSYLPVSTPYGEVSGGAAIFGRQRVVAPETQPVTTSRSPQAVFGEAISILGHDVEGTVRPGSQLTVTLDWRSLAPVDYDYTVFAHLLDKSGQIVAQADGQPLAGRYPTSLWEPGDGVRDVHLLTVPSDLPEGPAHLAIGLYRLETLQRLVATDGAGRPLEANQFLIPIQIGRGSSP